MRLIIVLCALVAIACSEMYYTTKYDSIDIDNILATERLLDFYVKCLLEIGTCNEEGTILKQVIPDALITGCRKCSPKQKVSVEKVIRYLYRHRKADWELLVKKYDPNNVYRKNYAHLLEKL